MDVKTPYQIENENNARMVQRMWDELPQELKEVLCDVMAKAQIVQNLDDGYGKIILEIQKKKVFSVKLMQEKIIKPLRAELV